jgi:2',3'-cyclic-nucleotide 2'-phosphodiesterase/3'-nucleotidase
MNKHLEIKIIHTTDVHGNFFPYDFINSCERKGSLARVSSYVKQLRETYGERLILLDGGDILQGQPTCYYCNYINTQQTNVAAKVINVMKYDAQTIGNHDIETGHDVYDKYCSEANCDILAANVIDIKSLKPYFKPYKIIEIKGMRIAIIGMLTPTIPYWLHEQLWSGMKFESIPECMDKWTRYVRNAEHADIVIGLFHSGFEGGINNNGTNENQSIETAANVAGIDLILCGHDHRLGKRALTFGHTKKINIINPSSNAYYVSESTITANHTENGWKLEDIKSKLVDIEEEASDEEFLSHFTEDMDNVKKYVNRKIGTIEESIFTKDSFFGPAPFSDFIHDVQLETTGADISLNAPLQFDACIKKGDIHVSDMFNLYTYENQLYAIRMTGKEVHNLLEMSYAQWIDTMKSEEDHIMLMEHDDKGRYHWRNLAFNFDSAAGINYEVDVTKEKGHKIKILRMSDGRPFSEDCTYTVAMNSYRGNGGGELLTKGAGIPLEEIPSRIEYISKKDQRRILMEYIERHGHINPKAHTNWKFTPIEWTENAIKRDRSLLFPDDKKLTD